MTKKLTSVCCITLMSLSLLGQNLIGSEKKRSFSFHLLEAYRFDESYSFEASEFSKLGFEGQVNFHFNDVIGLQLKGGWVGWSRVRENYLPILIGPEYTLKISRSLQLGLYGTIGPSLTIGNDFAGIFAAVESGVQFSSTLRQGFVIGASWGLYAAFHPSEFSILKGTVGWRF